MQFFKVDSKHKFTANAVGRALRDYLRHHGVDKNVSVNEVDKNVFKNWRNFSNLIKSIGREIK